MNKKKIKKRKKLTLPLRINMVFFAVFLLFSVLILKLGYLQIVEGKEYAKKIEETEQVTVQKPVPRGKIYDRNGKIIVDIEPLHAITYTREQQTTNEEMLTTAEKLATLIEIDTSKVIDSDKDKKDYWIMKNPKKASQLITNEEMKKVEKGDLKNSDTYKLQLERIKPEDIANLTPEEMKVIAILRQFNTGSALSPIIVKNKDVSPDELARVSEHLSELPGIDTSIDWERNYLYGNTLKTILGKVSSTEEGLPAEMIDYYLARGYNRNDRVGKSYLELQYEELLRGQKVKTTNVTDKSGNILSQKTLTEGKSGKDLVLTIDIDLQQTIEKIIEEELIRHKQGAATAHLDRTFVVVTNPKTGEVLSLAGKQYQRKDDGTYEMNDFSLGTFTTSYAMGSTVKGATVLTGYDTGAISMGTVWNDQPLHIGRTITKSSWTTMGSTNDLKALQRSSNVYMFMTAIEIGKIGLPEGTGGYIPYGPLRINQTAFSTMRNYFAQFGLGVQTGIDLPGEQVGYKGIRKDPGLLLDFAIGQLDTYTPLQMNQYVSTIANGGYRIKPHILKEVHEPSQVQNSLGSLAFEVQPTILNKLTMPDDQIDRVKEGFRLVTSSSQGTAVGYLGGKSYHPAGKTGTAQAFYDGPIKEDANKPTANVTFVGYAPYDNPEIAISVIVPWAYDSEKGPSMNLVVADRVFKAYFDLKTERANQGIPQN